jgi:hypothetical protein
MHQMQVIVVPSNQVFTNSFATFDTLIESINQMRCRIMELDPGPIENDDASNSHDPENCDTSTMCYDLVPSYLVPSDHVISAFQQGHQAFPLVKLKDNFTNFCPW